MSVSVVNKQTTYFLGISDKTKKILLYQNKAEQKLQNQLTNLMSNDISTQIQLMMEHLK